MEQPDSPDPKRSAREWRLLVEGVLTDSVLMRFIRKDGVTLRPEFPFLWRIDEQSCVEGIIDLLAVDVRNRECLIVDWKTNRITTRETQQLTDRYRPQLAAYRKAVADITCFEVDAALYSTATGQLLLYPRDELATEWNRLARLSAGELAEGLAHAPDVL